MDNERMIERKEKLVQIISEDIRDRFPKVNSIDVKITEAKGRFKSLIEVRFKRKRFFVKKIEDSLSLSLNRAKRALFRQCEKYEGRKFRYRHLA